MAPTRRDLLLCIRTHHPTTAISNSNYYKHAKSCLAHVLPGSPEKELEETSTTFVDAVRRRYKKARHFDRFKENPWFDCELKLKSPPVPPPVPTPPKPPTSPKRVVTRKLSFEQKKKRQQDYDTLKIRESHEGPAIVQAAVQYFRSIGCHSAAYVLKELKANPEEVGDDLRKFFIDTPQKLPKVSNARCLAYILDRGMTHVDWDETVKLVNTPGNRRLPSYSVLSEEKKKRRPRGKQYSFFFALQQA